jgi:hypothetical protein
MNQRGNGMFHGEFTKIFEFMGCLMILEWLVVEPYPSEKYEFVSWDYEIPN